MNFDHFYRTVSVIHQARTIPGTKAIATKCGLKMFIAVAGVWAVDEFLNLPARARALPDCSRCRSRRWPEAVRKDGE